MILFLLFSEIFRKIKSLRTIEIFDLKKMSKETNFEIDLQNQNDWSIIYKHLPFCDLQIYHQKKQHKYVISGTLKSNLYILSSTQPLLCEYQAADSPTYNYSFSGSQLPYPNNIIAFESSENCGNVPIENGRFVFHIESPNSYYSEMGKLLVPPEVRIRILAASNHIPVSHFQSVILNHYNMYRTLHHPIERQLNPQYFYDIRNQPPVRSQYQILLDSAYPNQNNQSSRFWNGKPQK